MYLETDDNLLHGVTGSTTRYVYSFPEGYLEPILLIASELL